MEIVQPLLEEGIKAILLIIVSIITVALIRLRPIILDELLPSLIDWLRAHIGEKNTKLVGEFAQQAYALAKEKYRESDGPEKLDKAINYVQERLKEKGINITDEAIQAAVEKARLDYKAAAEKQDTDRNN